ncbi:MAG: PQQ-dependent sugar dehydrogenase [Gammaproteobacteria bacterium]
MKITAFKIWIALFTLGVSSYGNAQINRDPVPSITEPMVVSTFEVDRLRIVPVVTGLENPFAMAFRSNGDILITERYRGQIRIVRDGRLLEHSVAGVPEVFGAEFRAGLQGIALHPDDDSLVYLAYTKPIEYNGEPSRTVALAKGRLVEDRLTEISDIFYAAEYDPAISASTLLFTPDRKLLMTVGGAVVYGGVGDMAQDPKSHYGKLLRLNDDGTVPRDNPFVASGEFLPEVYSVGHRNQLGLTYHPETGALWASENGPQGGDEVNIIEAGANYGWPIVSFSRQYRGDWVTAGPGHADFVAPVVMWWPSIAPAGMTFYSGDKIPRWQGNLFVGSMMEGRIPNTGHLERIVFNSRGEEIRRESLLRELRQRIIDVQQGPDGYLYLLADEADGALYRLEALPNNN